MTAAQFALVVGADLKWLQNARRILGRPIRNDASEARWFGLVREFQIALECSLSDAARMADLAIDASDEQPILVLSAGKSHCITITFDVYRSRRQHLLRLARAIELPPIDLRGRPATSWRTLQAAIERRITRRDDEYELRSNAMHGLPLERLTKLGPISELLTDLVESGAGFIVAGETAAALQGALITPSALDILYDTRAPGTLNALATQLRRWRAAPRGLEGAGDNIDEHDLRAVPTLALTARGCPVNLWDQLEPIGGFGEAMAHLEKRASFALVPFHVLGLPALIREFAAGREEHDAEMRFQLGILELVRQQRLRFEAFRARRAATGTRLPDSPRMRQNP